ncbi:hypothetical protein HNY73_001118 [Argiope bruennichi]|uniref:Uncharacterized protein n=1 Tax=Argiope bruennichi TaxID=94029 RepID=A0A8T0G2V2_ARGBR|nr:hypothetical protein HNY73_001118 [Argiope bruennichi]
MIFLLCESADVAISFAAFCPNAHYSMSTRTSSLRASLLEAKIPGIRHTREILIAHCDRCRGSSIWNARSMHANCQWRHQDAMVFFFAVWMVVWNYQ